MIHLYFFILFYIGAWLFIMCEYLLLLFIIICMSIVWRVWHQYIFIMSS